MAPVVKYPRTRRLLVPFIVGDFMEQWIDDGLRQIESWGRSIGCRSIVMHGRNGWTRRLTKDGWRRDAVVLRKDLKP